MEYVSINALHVVHHQAVQPVRFLQIDLLHLVVSVRLDGLKQELLYVKNAIINVILVVSRVYNVLNVLEF